MATGGAGAAGFFGRFFEDLGHPLRWSAVDKCLLGVAILLPLFLASYALNLYVLWHPEIAPYYNREFLALYLRGHEVVIAGWLLVGALGVYLRRRSPENRIYAYATSQFGCLVTALFMYVPGYFTTPYLMGILGAGVVLLMFFEMRVAVWALVTLLGSYLALSLAIAAGAIPAAPLLSYPPYENGRLSLWWVLVNTGLCLVLMALAFSIAGFAIFQWRDREEKLEGLSKTDDLTNLANRRHFFERLEAEVARSVRLGHPLSLILCDADRFKNINDTHGHPAGDEVLCKIAEVLRQCHRLGVDTIARIGGDEFAILLAETDLDGAHTLAARVLDAIRRESFERNGRAFSVTLSMGAVTRRGEAFDGDTLIEAADTLLYRAKNAGRDRTAAALAEFLPGGE